MCKEEFTQEDMAEGCCNARDTEKHCNCWWDDCKPCCDCGHVPECEDDCAGCSDV